MSLTKSKKAFVWSYLDKFLRKEITVTFEKFFGEIRCTLEREDEAKRAVTLHPTWYEGLTKASDLYSFIEKGE